jgi:hypothetical protein
LNKEISWAAPSTSTRQIFPPADVWSPPAQAARYVVVISCTHAPSCSTVLHIRTKDDGRIFETRALLQVMAQFTVPVPGTKVAEATDAVTLGEALHAAAQTSAGDKPVGLADAAALQAAEARATGLGGNVRGGVAAAAQQAAETNAKRAEDGGGGGDRVTLRDVVGGDAAAAMAADKVATREDAEKVAAAAARNVQGKGAGGGVAEAVVAAADMNEGRMM